MAEILSEKVESPKAMSRFHAQLYELVLQEKPSIIVETGYATGLSAMHILAAMDINGVGTLYSVESFTNQDIWHPRFRYCRGFSQSQLPEIAAKTPAWDCFLHDSDHEFECQTFEYQFAWEKLCKGGILITDDAEWCGADGKPHNAWSKFLERCDYTDLTTIGCAQWVRKV